MTTLKTLALEEAQPGMHLGQDLRDAAGQMLLPKGSELSEATLKSLARRNVENLVVVLPEVVDEAALAARREASRRRLLHLFRRAGDPASQELLRLMQEYRQERPQ